MIILHSDLQPQLKYMNYFIYTSHHFTPHGRYEVNKLASLPMCGFIAQLVEHRTGIAEVTGSNPVEALIFSGFVFPIAYIGKFTAMIILHSKNCIPKHFLYCNLTFRMLVNIHFQKSPLQLYSYHSFQKL